MVTVVKCDCMLFTAKSPPYISHFTVHPLPNDRSLVNVKIPLTTFYGDGMVGGGNLLTSVTKRPTSHTAEPLHNSPLTISDPKHYLPPITPGRYPFPNPGNNSVPSLF